MSSRSSVTVASACVVLALAFLAVGPAAAQDAKKLQGTWEAQRVVLNGAVLAKKPQPLVITGATFKWPGIVGTTSGRIKLDSSKAPKWIDFQVTGGKQRGKTFVGIYKLDGDALTISTAVENLTTDRPKEFKPVFGSQTIVWEYKRKK